MTTKLSNVSEKKEKNLKKESDIVDDVKTKRELYKKDQELEKLEEQNALLQEEIDAIRATKTKEAKSTVPDNEILVKLQAQVEMLSKQVMTGQKTPEGKLIFRQPTAADLVEDSKEATFIARNVFYVVGSYTDHNGIEVYPPHKIIIFNYASSDIRKEGRESEILNFSTYTTNLKTEIEFLRNSPYYGISFSENTNEMAKEDLYETQYKIQAASQLSGLSPEAIFTRAEQYNIPNWRNKSAEQLRFLIVHEMAKQFRKQNEDLQKEIAKRRALGAVIDKTKEE